jgi:hypothetical protein
LNRDVVIAQRSKKGSRHREERSDARGCYWDDSSLVIEYKKGDNAETAKNWDFGGSWCQW